MSGAPVPVSECCTPQVGINFRANDAGELIVAAMVGEGVRNQQPHFKLGIRLAACLETQDRSSLQVPPKVNEIRTEHHTPLTVYP